MPIALGSMIGALPAYSGGADTIVKKIGVAQPPPGGVHRTTTYNTGMRPTPDDTWTSPRTRAIRQKRPR